MEYQWQWDVIWSNLDVFVKGALVTLQLTAVTMAIGLVGGLFIGLGRMARHKVVRGVSTAIVEVFRDTPLLVQVFWVFYCLPIITGIKLGAILSAVLAFSLQASVYLAEVYRAGIQSIERGQMEAARSVGMSFWQGMRRIVLPQAIRRMIPPILNVTANFMKASSLASVVGVFELLRQANNLISNTWRPLEAYTAVAFFYFFLIYPVVWLTGRIERKLSRQLST